MAEALMVIEDHGETGPVAGPPGAGLSVSSTCLNEAETVEETLRSLRHSLPSVVMVGLDIAIVAGLIAFRRSWDRPIRLPVGILDDIAFHGRFVFRALLAAAAFVFSSPRSAIEFLAGKLPLTMGPKQIKPIRIHDAVDAILVTGGDGMKDRLIELMGTFGLARVLSAAMLVAGAFAFGGSGGSCTGGCGADATIPNRVTCIGIDGTCAGPECGCSQTITGCACEKYHRQNFCDAT